MEAKVLEVLSRVGHALAAEPDIDRLLLMVLHGAKEVTDADGVTLYKVNRDRLDFALLQSNSLGIEVGAGDERLAAFPSIPLKDPQGKPNHTTVASNAVLQDTTVNIADVYAAESFDFAGTREFDRRSGYRTRSVLTVPIKDDNGRVIAAIQLLNRIDPDSGAIVEFTDAHQHWVEALASQASVAMEKHRLTHYRDAITGSLVIRGPRGDQQVSKARLLDLLELCALPPAAADNLAGEILCALVEREESAVPQGDFEALVYAMLHERSGKTSARRFQAWMDFKRSRVPLVVLLAGSSGTGKSTVAAELSLRLDIGSVQSTDTLREVMRLLVPEPLAPELHHSSFEAWRGLPCLPGSRQDPTALVLEGFLAQANKVAVAAEGVIRRSVKEKSSTILEGIHLRPGFYQRLRDVEAIVVPILLVTHDLQDLRNHLVHRGIDSPARGSERYLDQIKNIWRIQSQFLEEAASSGVSIVPNIQVRDTVRQVLGIVSDAVAGRFSEYPEDPIRVR